MKRFLSLIVSLVVLVMATDAGATNTTYGPSQHQTITETASGDAILLKCPSLAAAGADTLIAVVDITKRLVPYMGASSVPTAKILLSAVHVQVAGYTAADSARVGVEFGFGGSIGSTGLVTGALWYAPTSINLNSEHLLAGKVPIANLYTVYPWGAKWMRLKVVNKHATIARAPYIVATFPKMPVVSIPRNGL
jgi:hypothetical protein